MILIRKVEYLSIWIAINIWEFKMKWFHKGIDETPTI